MIGDKTILVVVPARGGSTGVKLKNLRPVGGVPLVARVGDVVGSIPMIDRAVVSTDHDEIAAVAEAAGLAAPFRRPTDLSGDFIGDWDILNHALKVTEHLDGKPYDIVVMLQPTSPLRRPDDVVATIRKLVAEEWDAVWTVSPTDSKAHPLKQLTLSEVGEIEYYDSKGAEIKARQQLSTVYHRNGVAYAFTRACILDQGNIKGRRTGALVIEGHYVSIDTEFDIEFVEYLMTNQASR